MSKIILKFDGDEERDEALAAMNAWKYQAAFEQIWQEMFRPRHRHGYVDKALQDLLGCEVEEEQETAAQKDCNALMEKLESIYQKIREEYDI